MRLMTRGSRRCSEKRPPTLAEAMAAWRLNPPPDRMIARVAGKLRTFCSWSTEDLKRTLTAAERDANRYEFLAENPPDCWTAEQWFTAMERAADAAATCTALRRVLAGRR